MAVGLAALAGLALGWGAMVVVDGLELDAVQLRTVPHRRYAVALVTTCLLPATIAARGVDRHVWAPLALAVLLAPLAVIDIERRIVPNRVLGPAALLALAITAALEPGELGERLISAAAAGGFLLIAALINPSGLGMGDVKLIAVVGLFLGRGVAVALVAGLLAATLAVVAILLRHGFRAGRKATIPLAPFLAAGAAVALVAGDALVNAYLPGGG